MSTIMRAYIVFTVLAIWGFTAAVDPTSTTTASTAGSSTADPAGTGGNGNGNGGNSQSQPSTPATTTPTPLTCVEGTCNTGINCYTATVAAITPCTATTTDQCWREITGNDTHPVYTLGCDGTTAKCAPKGVTCCSTADCNKAPPADNGANQIVLSFSIWSCLIAIIFANYL